MTYDFDTVIDRKGTGSLKWELYGDRDVIPMWVADMDFSAPPAVLDRLRERVDHGVLGYAMGTNEARTAVVDGVRRRRAAALSMSWLYWGRLLPCPHKPAGIGPLPCVP